MNRGRSGTPGGPPKPVTVKTAGHWFWFDRSMNDLRIQQIRDLVSVEEVPALAEAGGVLATLRY